MEIARHFGVNIGRVSEALYGEEDLNMTDKAAIAGTYSDFKIIRSRKVAQLVVEVPIEQAQALIAALGLPNPAEETWVAVARLERAKEHDWRDFSTRVLGTIESPPQAVPEAPRPHRPFEQLPYPQQAALRCQDLSFRQFLRDAKNIGTHNAEEAAGAVRMLCEVASRKDIRPGTKAEKLWLRLNTHYTLWQSAREAA